ncbi:regulator of chromosome condensation 1/beta-lactamase-inhibitor protein II [Pyronema omphalodes]|nr:regulator of chromosome condensation 1/beta-lactamase-inhibitor protein II [Pyronema omphalodes]
MAISLSTLPNELKLRILHFAGWQAAVQLSAVSKHFNDICREPTFWKRAMIETFHERIDYFNKGGDWQGAFKTLASGRLTGWGFDWELMFASPQDIRNQSPIGYFPRKIAVKKYRGVIDIQCGVSIVSVLTISGTVLLTSTDAGLAVLPGHRPQSIKFPCLDERIIQIASGEFHHLALSASGRVWCIKIGSFGFQPAVVRFLTSKGAVENPICTKVVAGFAGSGALIENHGLFLWFEKYPSSRFRFITFNPGNPNDAPPVENVDVKTICYSTDAFGHAVPEDPVVDFAIGKDFVVFVTASGKVFALRAGHQQQERIVPVQLENIVAPEGAPKINRVKGNFRDFAVFNNDGLVHLLKDDSIKTQYAHSENRTAVTVNPYVIEELKNHRIVDIAFGDKYGVALTYTGKAISWGRYMVHHIEQIAGEGSDKVIRREITFHKPMAVNIGEEEGDFFAYKVSAAAGRCCMVVAQVHGQSALA